MKRHVVILQEYERGWGSRQFSAQSYNCKEDALARVKEVNDQNTEPTAPDYYIIARYEESMSSIVFEEINGPGRIW